MRKLAIMAALLAGISGQARAADELRDDGNQLLSECAAVVRYADNPQPLTGRANEDFYSCIGYLSGFTTGMEFMALVSRKPVPYCMPDTVIHGQMARVVVKYLRDHPEKLHLSQGLLVAAAMMEAYPCDKAKL